MVPCGMEVIRRHGAFVLDEEGMICVRRTATWARGAVPDPSVGTTSPGEVEVSGPSSTGGPPVLRGDNNVAVVEEEAAGAPEEGAAAGIVPESRNVPELDAAARALELSGTMPDSMGFSMKETFPEPDTDVEDEVDGGARESNGIALGLGWNNENELFFHKF